MISVLLGSVGMSSALPVCKGSPKSISKDEEVKSWSNCHGSIIYGNAGRQTGNTYVGEWKDGKYDGQGTVVSYGHKFVGGWKDGLFNGQGTYTSPDGREKYVGEWKGDRKHGQGTLTRADGSKYIGEFKDGKEHGQGTMTYANGD